MTLNNSINLSNQLFFEADQLSAQAYALLSKQPVTTQTLQMFSEMKKQADEHYRQARQEWLRTKDNISLPIVRNIA
ncbi:hypothetical protein [Pseudomonas fluorescens]|uniref:Uncharacterized protein n=1 Tax=Pseudomonas fluorescens TaxID=294 RepID=A0A5E7C982_PSEFL|nr:hypothetical protein [Pseudomonas fluorescens]VVN92523.1 hypothetical protein PS691_01980 [Pseudomonas fluorescens]